jgi:hypothetical protein
MPIISSEKLRVVSMLLFDLTTLFLIDSMWIYLFKNIRILAPNRTVNIAKYVRPRLVVAEPLLLGVSNASFLGIISHTRNLYICYHDKQACLLLGSLWLWYDYSQSFNIQSVLL